MTKKRTRRLGKKPNRYAALIERIFKAHYEGGHESFVFTRTELESTAKKLRIKLPKNLGDIIYSFRYRAYLPEGITRTAPAGKRWEIKGAGAAQYKFELVYDRAIVPNPQYTVIKVPDGTPGLVEKYALTDEQATLARVRYNRLLDIFTGVTCYALQSHLRTTVPEIGQLEIDELYVGVDKRGVHYVFPVQAKGGKDRLGIVQVEQDIAACNVRFPELVCRPIGALSMPENTIAMFEFQAQNGDILIAAERHYRLVPSETVTDVDLKQYKAQPE
ncbi:MAG TPA: hypothetical protein VFA60_14425 [Terriglobales bacterium]|nr:hypothetical protein [Terriglobales bacterium]